MKLNLQKKDRNMIKEKMLYEREKMVIVIKDIVQTISLIYKWAEKDKESAVGPIKQEEHK